MTSFQYRYIPFFLACWLSLQVSVWAQTTTYGVNKILSLNISSSINPATTNYLESGFKHAHINGYNLILIKMNTPGGLITTTKQILTMFGESDIPIVVWVTPEGASATSAGAIIASGAHLLYMNTGTNIGAATPITLGKDIEQPDLKNKAINDLKALVQSLAQTRGRSEKDFGMMIEEAKSFKAQDALNNKLINGLVHSENDLFQAMNNQSIKVKNHDLSLVVINPSLDEYEMDLGQKLLNILSNPSLTYILFLIGAALIYLEFQAPGGYVAGGLGFLCVILSGIGFHLLPLNFGALGLILLAFILFILEAFITSFGLIALAGLVSLTIGSLFLFRTDDAYLHFSKMAIFSSILSIGSFLLIILYLFVKAMKNNDATSFHNLTGSIGVITQIIDNTHAEKLYYIKVKGEIWKARSPDDMPINTKCVVLDNNKKEIILNIKRN